MTQVETDHILNEHRRQVRSERVHSQQLCVKEAQLLVTGVYNQPVVVKLASSYVVIITGVSNLEDSLA